MTPTSLLRMSGIVLGVTALILLAGCRKTTTVERPAPAPAVPASPAPPQLTAAERDDAIHTVVAYLTALKNRKYQTAYEMLSRDSQADHSLSDFERLGKQGMPPLDLETAKVSSDGAETLVEIAFIEDPGSHGFYLARDNGAWKIVYRGGSPGAPYPSSSSGG